MTDNNNTQAAIDAGIALAQAFDINGTPAVLKPAGASVELFASMRQTPVRTVATFQALTMQAFIDYFKRFGTADSVIAYNSTAAFFKAVIDYHTTNTPSWCQHVATYTCPQTEEWKSWIANDGKDLDQVQFATFIENSQADIVDPPAAEMLEIAHSLQAKTDVNFRSAVRLDNGQVQFAYNELVNGQAGASGQLAIPQLIQIGIKPFIGGVAYKLEARFRYRITAAKLLMRYELVKPHLIIQDAVNDIVQIMKTETDAANVYEAAI